MEIFAIPLTALFALAAFGFLAWHKRLPNITNPIRGFAVICVAGIAIYIGWMGYRLSEILASPGWCGKALQAEKISAQGFGGLTACVDLLKIQLNAVARVNLVYAGVFAGCLLVLVVIVIAGGKLSFNVSPTGAGANIGDATPVTVVNPPSDPVPTTAAPAPPAPPGPAMPPPPA